MTEIIVGGVIKKDNKYLLVQEAQEKCRGKWNIPTGHLDPNESVFDGAKREIYEETGCTAEIINIMGITIEEKSMTNFKQISYVFLGRVINKTNELHLTKKEELEKTIVLWKSFEEGLEKIKNSEKELVGSVFDSKYQSLFMVRRDAEILNYYQNNKQKILKQ